MAWDDDKRAKVIKAYVDAKPTPETSITIVQELAEQFAETVNGIRMVLSKADVYIKKADTKEVSTKKATTGTRVPKADSLNALKELLTKFGVVVDSDVIDKLTGKQAIYFTDSINTIIKTPQ